MKKEKTKRCQERVHLRKNQVDMKKKKTIIKNSVVSLRSSLDTAQERVSELEDWSDKSPRTLHRKTKSWKTQNSN